MASNTLIAYPIVSRYGLQQKPSVTLSVGSTTLSLLIALIMLAGSRRLILQSRWSALLGTLHRQVCRILRSNDIPDTATHEMVSAPVQRFGDAVYLRMAMLFMSAALSQMVGIEGVFGAFFAGLILNRYIPHVSPLMNRLEFTGNALFIPYFLIGVGMLINVGLLFQGSHILSGHLLHRVLRNLGKSHRCLCRLLRIPVAAVIGSHDVRFDFCPCRRQYRHGDGGYEPPGGSEHLSGQR